MNLKKYLLTIVLAIMAILLLQTAVNAETPDYSGYDELLTETGLVATDALTGTETVIAGVKGKTAGTISADVTNKKITIENFISDRLDIFIGDFSLCVEGENKVEDLKKTSHKEIYTTGNGSVRVSMMYDYSGMFTGTMAVDSAIFIDPSYYTNFYFGNSIENTTEIDYFEFYISETDLDGMKIKEAKTEEIAKIFQKCDTVSLRVKNNTIIPTNIFKTINEKNKTLVVMDFTGKGTLYFEGTDIVTLGEFQFLSDWKKDSVWPDAAPAYNYEAIPLLAMVWNSPANTLKATFSTYKDFGDIGDGKEYKYCLNENAEFVLKGEGKIGELIYGPFDTSIYFTVITSEPLPEELLAGGKIQLEEKFSDFSKATAVLAQLKASTENPSEDKLIFAVDNVKFNSEKNHKFYFYISNNATDIPDEYSELWVAADKFEKDETTGEHTIYTTNVLDLPYFSELDFGEKVYISIYEVLSDNEITSDTIEGTYKLVLTTKEVVFGFDGQEGEAPEEEPKDEQKEETKYEPKNEIKNEDPTTIKKPLAYAGGETAIIVSIVVIAGLVLFGYIKFRELKDI